MDGQVSYTCCAPLKRESIVRVMTMSPKGNQEAVALVMVSAKGRVAVYDTTLKVPSASFTLRLSAPVAIIKTPLSTPSTTAATSSQRRATSTVAHNGFGQKTHLSGWITDAVFMNEYNTLVVASSDRCLQFFTTVVVPFQERFRLDGMKDIPTTLAYMPPEKSVLGRSEPILGVGDDGGDVFILRFLKATRSLFKKREVEGHFQHIYWRELHLQAGMLTLTILPGSHDSPVLQIDLKRLMQRAVSCSKSPMKSLVVRHIRQQQQQQDGPFMPSITLCSVPGITCFDYDEEKGIIVSGSSDGKIRLWSPVHLAKPWMVLSGHTTAIAAVCLCDQSNYLWSLCDQSELRCWDVDLGHCIQTIFLEFTNKRKGRVQFSQRPLLLIGSTLYVSCGDTVALVQMDESHSKKFHIRSRDLQSGRTAKDDGKPSKQSAESKIPHRFREGLLDYGYHDEDDVFDNFIAKLKGVYESADDAEQRLKELNGLGNIVAPHDREPEQVYEWETEVNKPLPPTNLVPINQIKLKELQEEMEVVKRHVKDGAPFCGLRLPQPMRIDLPPGLPVTTRMRRMGIESFNSLDEVRAANFDLFSERLASLASERTSLASSILSYYRQKKVGDSKVSSSSPKDHHELGSQLHVSSRSPASSRKSSISSLSPSSATSLDE